MIESDTFPFPPFNSPPQELLLHGPFLLMQEFPSFLPSLSRRYLRSFFPTFGEERSRSPVLFSEILSAS